MHWLALASLVCFLCCKPSDAKAGAGEQVGSKLRNMGDEIRADVQQNKGSSEFLKSFGQAWASKELVAINPAVSEVMRKTDELANSLVDSDGLCQRRWTAACPDGWTASDGGQCLPPASYGGACRKIQSFAGQNIGEKQRFAEACKAPWPCDDDCTNGRDYSDLCPERWEDDGNGFCSAPPDFQSRCASEYNFGNMDIKTKTELAQTCGFNWKCKVFCEQDYSKACPKDWDAVPDNPGMCTAPPTYAGACSFSVNTSRMTGGQKKAYARKCGIEFPCSGVGTTIGQAKANESDAYSVDGPIDKLGVVVETRFPSFASQDGFVGNPGTMPRKFRMPSGPLGANQAAGES